MFKKLPAFLLILAIEACTSCNNNSQKIFSYSSVKDSATNFMNSIAAKVTAQGPSAWLSLFEDTPEFFMASDGTLALNGYDSAKIFINNVLINT